MNGVKGSAPLLEKVKGKKGEEGKLTLPLPHPASSKNLRMPKANGEGQVER